MKIIILLLLLIFLPLQTEAEEILNSPADKTKGVLPMFTPDFTLYDQLIAIGEMPIWIGQENSKLSIEQGGLTIAFFLDKDTGNWSFLSTDPKHNTWFVSSGKKWQKLPMDVPNDLTLGGEELAVDYCAPFKDIESKLRASGKTEMSSGFPDRNFLAKNVENATVYLFADSIGAWTTVTHTAYTNGSKVACIDATGSGKREVAKKAG